RRRTCGWITSLLKESRNDSTKQSNKVARAVKDPNDPDSQAFEISNFKLEISDGFDRRAYLVFRDSNPILKSEISDLRFEIEVDLLQFGKSVDRRQYLATEATRPSRASTVTNGRQKRSVALFCVRMARKRWACSSVG